MEWISDPNAWVALLTLTVLEIVLGIDNIVFISILVGKLPQELQARGRTIGLGLAMITRILLLLTISIIISLTNPLFNVFGLDISVRDLILMGGGLFLLAKATLEIHERLEGEKAHATDKTRTASFTSVIIQIILLDIVFSLDSVITAVGMADDIGVMVTAVIIAVIVMLFAAGPISHFVNQHPTVKMLALSFLLLIGVALVAEGVHQHIPKGYIYFAMGFSVFVEMLNLRASKKKEAPVELRPIYVKEEPELPAGAGAGAGTEAPASK
ncbi:MAG TPA: TerC family protein [Chloroflexia bacterium]|nr:TerC family protein [Chloroflexia bacterium]